MQPASAFLSARIEIAHSWLGHVLPEVERSSVELTLSSDAARGASASLTWDAPFDPLAPMPPHAAGYCADLWRYDVVEVFIAGPSGTYLEIEVAAHGHYAAFFLGARRRIDEHFAPLHFEHRKTGLRFRGHFEFAASRLPAGPLRWNAYRIAGQEPLRQYFAAYPGKGERPDFHQLECFAPLQLRRSGEP
jgi:hypothetical protein